MLSCVNSRMSDILKGKKILVTRPVHQANRLCSMIEQAGGVPIRLPAIDIQPIVDRGRIDIVLSRLDKYAIAIFVSRNAVFYAMPLLGDRKSALAALQIIALGQGTAAALSAAGLPSAIHGGAQADSEALLDLPVLQEAAVRKQRIVIFRGTGGRELLADTLRARGAEVDYAEVYQRRKPHYDKSLLDKIWCTEKPDQLVVTSSEALHNLFTMLGPGHRGIMLDTPMVVIGARMAEQARELGFKRQPAIADATSDEGLLRAILQNIAV